MILACNARSVTFVWGYSTMPWCWLHYIYRICLTYMYGWLCGWLGSEHNLTNSYMSVAASVVLLGMGALSQPSDSSAFNSFALWGDQRLQRCPDVPLLLQRLLPWWWVSCCCLKKKKKKFFLFFVFLFFKICYYSLHFYFSIYLQQGCSLLQNSLKSDHR